MDEELGFFRRPFGFRGYAGLPEFRRNGTIGLALVLIPPWVMAPLLESGIQEAHGQMMLLLAVIALFLFGVVYFLVWSLPLFIRRARSAGIHWAFSLPLALLLTLPFALALLFLPGPTHEDDHVLG